VPGENLIGRNKETNKKERFAEYSTGNIQAE
jgi:hypothetical protein